VIGRECQRHGCSLPIDMIGALAGVCRTLVQNALRAARRLGVILVKERRIPGRKSLTNVVTIASKEWSGWLRIGGGAIGFRNLNATDKVFSPMGAKGELRAFNKGGTRESSQRLALQGRAGGLPGV
jgi:hypothetical protein